MPNYFDYISESAEVEVNSPDDVNEIYNEMDASMGEFDAYVQEGVGLKILIGVGIAAALGGLIALIVYMCKKKGDKGVVKAAEETEKAAKAAKKDPDADKKLQENPHTEKGLKKLFAPFGKSKRNKKGNRKPKELGTTSSKVAEGMIFNVSDDEDYYSEALTPSHENIKKYEKALEFSLRNSNKSLEAIGAIVKAAIEAHESQRAKTEYDIMDIQKAIRPAYLNLGALEEKLMNELPDLDFDTSGVTEDIVKGMTIEEIILLCGIIETVFNEMSSEMKVLKKAQADLKEYETGSYSDRKFKAWADTSIAPMINKLITELTNMSREMVLGLGEFKIALKQIIDGGGVTSVAKSLAFDDLNMTIDRNSKVVS